MKNFAGLLGGLLFGAGLVIGEMVDPARVLAFLTIGPAWDATLVFVLAAAVVVATIGYRLVGRRAAPLFDADFHMPTSQVIDRRLIGGAVIFGLGWGMTGYCPGPALVGVMTFDPRAVIFLVAFMVGLSIYEKWFSATTQKTLATADG